MKLSEEVRRHENWIDPQKKEEWTSRIAALESELEAAKAENERLRNGLQRLSDGDTEWINDYYAEACEVMAEYAKKLLGAE